MLSKEEIEKAKQCLKETIENTYAEGKAIKLNNALNYIKQLESREQKLIEKLEEHANRKIPLAEDADYIQGYRDLARDLLEILKGENNE